MSIYIKEDGRRILSLSDEDLKDLGWIEENVPDTKLTRELMPTESDV